MKTWEGFKKNAKQLNTTANDDLEEIEIIVGIVNAIIAKRNELGYSQRNLATICGLPQSSVARIESFTVKPNIETLIKIMKPLGLTLTVTTL